MFAPSIQNQLFSVVRNSVRSEKPPQAGRCRLVRGNTAKIDMKINNNAGESHVVVCRLPRSSRQNFLHVSCCSRNVPCFELHMFQVSFFATWYAAACGTLRPRTVEHCVAQNPRARNYHEAAVVKDAREGGKARADLTAQWRATQLRATDGAIQHSAVQHKPTLQSKSVQYRTAHCNTLQRIAS